MTADEQRRGAKEFAERWKDKGDEKQDTQTFWLELLQKVLGVVDPYSFIDFENRVKIGKTTYIDAVISSTEVIIEQKSLKHGLDNKTEHSGLMLTPYEQAKRYADNRPYNRRTRWIVTCDFATFRVYDMDAEEPEKCFETIYLKDLENEFYRLEFLTDSSNRNVKKEEEISVNAGKIVRKLYDMLLKQYEGDDEENKKSLNKLCVRLVFCLYAEDAGIFGERNKFYNYMSLHKSSPADARNALINLFEVLGTKEEERDRYLEPKLSEFDYVNGGLFADSREELQKQIPFLTEEILYELLENISAGFDWSRISPTIFGAVFESTLNPETRRAGGMHYTSIENIHKVIDPLFLDDFRREFEEIKNTKQSQVKRKKSLIEFQEKLAAPLFLDPAAGSGNFLTESYISLRTLENEVIQELQQNGETFLDMGIIKVQISQFCGIEINDFAVTVAKTALWIAEAQMKQKTEDLAHFEFDYFPLKTAANIVEGNALKIDWEEVAPKDKLKFIMGNPPFVGNALLSDEQKQDRERLFSVRGGDLDYVACWYKKAAEFIKDTFIQCAFVSTNSICQGQQVFPLWKDIMESGVVINFAYRPFKWHSEATLMAQVYCVIIGFSRYRKSEPRIFKGEETIFAQNINGYLLNAPNVFIEKRRQPLFQVPVVIKGFQPTDNGYLLLNDEEKAEILKKEPKAEKWIRPFITAKEFINGKNRWCLWLADISPKELNALPLIKQRVIACREWREQQKKTGDAYKLRDTPSLMRPNSNFKEVPFIIIPAHSGENRKYIPFGFASKGDIPGNSLLLAIDANIYHFGILCSSVHMAWVKAVCGRLEMRYRYTSDIVYNNFPWCTPTDKQKAAIEKAAQAILDARKLYPNSSLADLYNKSLMPTELQDAHKANDRAVMAAYGFSPKMTEEEIVAELFKMYGEMTEK